jgi:superfamily II DNA/RNA helicase
LFFPSQLGLILQKAQFKAVESLREPKSWAIVVATNVEARGLDIPSVATVVHYDVARQVDTFIHRAGCTGVSLSRVVWFGLVWFGLE